MTYYHTRKPRRETGIRTIRIRNIATQVSHERGALLIWGKPAYKGMRVSLEGREGEVDLDATVEQQFVPVQKNGRIQYVVNCPHLVPGTYLIRTNAGYHDYDRVTITSKFVTQLDWS